ncbi:CAP domain-containing protein [Paenibacillus monticola]|uniref:Serine protease n=1 Tax=Paenibacillus monticola TaxID=2666075 RepID=A0A7X2H4D5_9BACL|nr:CAP domain-containing protein [Paenibacillus monticola]MRN53299.1 serine protease [Paenibacillus monticola]
MKSKTLRAMIGGSVAAVMALSISLPYTASAAANDTTVTKAGTSYAQLLQYLSKYNIKGFSFIIVDGVTGSTPTTKPTAAPTSVPIATPVPTKAPVATAVPTKAPVASPAPTKAPVATPAPTKAPVAVSTNTSYTQQIVTLVNKERATAGLAPVSSLDSLNKVAAAKATDMRSNNYFSHTSPTYGSPFDMMASFGVTYSYAGENIAMGQKSPEEVMTAWMNSPGHRANILSANFNYIGVGFDNNYWVQEFVGK